jgi:hypothetical protein
LSLKDGVTFGTYLTLGCRSKETLMMPDEGDTFSRGETSIFLTRLISIGAIKVRWYSCLEVLVAEELSLEVEFCSLTDISARVGSSGVMFAVNTFWSSSSSIFFAKSYLVFAKRSFPCLSNGIIL